MNLQRFCLILPLALAFARVEASTFQLTSNLDNSFIKTPASGSPGQPGYVQAVYSTTVEAPFVGVLTLAYEAENELGNGSYAWSSLSNLSLSAVFAGAGPGGADITFNHGHLDFDSSKIYLQIINGNFFFTNSSNSGTSLSGNSVGGSANFINGNYLFTTQPLNNVTRMGFGDYVVEYNALYQLLDISTASTGISPGQPGFSLGTTIYMGNYGNPTDNLEAIPEPSALSLLVVGLGGVIALRRCRRSAV